MQLPVMYAEMTSANEITRRARIAFIILVVGASFVSQITIAAESISLGQKGQLTKPTITISPTTLAQYENFTIRGSGFTPKGLVFPFFLNIGQDFFPADSTGNFTKPWSAVFVGQVPMYCLDVVSGIRSNTVTLSVTGTTQPVSSATNHQKTTFSSPEVSNSNQVGSMTPQDMGIFGVSLTAIMWAFVLALVAPALVLVYRKLRSKQRLKKLSPEKSKSNRPLWL